MEYSVQGRLCRVDPMTMSLCTSLTMELRYRVTTTSYHHKCILTLKGLVAFGESVLKATELNKAIKNMYDAKKYKKMVFYVEACESGSMFKVS